MNRRDLLILGSTAIAWPSVVCAQGKATPVIGWLGLGSPGSFTHDISSLHQGLGDMGFVEHQNVAIEYRWAEGQLEQLPALAADLASRNIDVILASGGSAAARAARHATHSIPIVFVTGADPVADGLVTSLARPGGNLTGVTIFTAELMPKRVELITELLPQARRIALLVNPNGSSAKRTIADVRQAALAKGMVLEIVNASSEVEFEPAFTSLRKLRIDALVEGNDVLFFNARHEIVALAARCGMPTIYEWREFVEAGGLISYGTNIAWMYREAGAYVGRVLKGAKPADLPIQQPTKFDLVINLKTAKALDLTIPQSLLARADEVIE